MGGCLHSVAFSKVRPDACWVNRSKVFDELCKDQEMASAREDARKVLWHLFGRDYLALPRKQAKTVKLGKTSEDAVESASEEEAAEEKHSAAIQSGKGAAQHTRHPFGHIFASSSGFGKDNLLTLELREHWRNILGESLRLFLPFKMLPIPRSGFPETELQREMFSKAAARLAQIHTKQKQQEIERQNREALDEGLRKMEADSAYDDAINRLNQFYENRAARLRQIDQWDRVLREWVKTDTDDIAAATVLRIEAVKRLQDELRDEKFGDPNLFIELAEENFKTAWWRDGNADPSILRNYLRGKKARTDAEHLKVASYRHPDPYQNPVFCQFGVSRPHIAFRRLAPIKSHEPGANDVRAVEILLWDGSHARRRILLASSKRFDCEIGSGCDLVMKSSDELPPVARRSRLGKSDMANDADGKLPRVAGVFDPQRIRSRSGDEPDGDDEPALKEPAWNGALQADRTALKAIGSFGKGGTAKSAKLRERLHWSLTVSLSLQPQGPWFEFVRSHSEIITPDYVYDRDLKQNVWATSPKKSRDTWRGTTYPFKHTINTDHRGTMAYHALSGIADLRVLSVDLGHRFAAACAVWHTLSQRD